MRNLVFATLLVVFLVATLSACSRTSQFQPTRRTDGGPAIRAVVDQASRTDDPKRRTFGTRDHESIFSPLDLPAPSEVRLGSGAPGPDYWQQQCDYRIRATLDADARTVTASERIVYYNNAPHELPFIWMQLEQNLFSKDSLGSARSRPTGRFGNRDRFDGGYEIHAVRFGDGSSASMQVYDTLARIDLPSPLPAHSGVLILEIDYSFKVPEYGSDRHGIEEVDQGTIFEVAQWFPHVCKYDDVHGWNTLPYLGQGEFYTDFGDYDIELTVPRSHIVACTGTLLNAEQVLTPVQQTRLAEAAWTTDTVMIVNADEVGTSTNRPVGDGPLTWKFRAENVRTVAWASSDAFIWDACAVDGNADKPGGTLVQSLYPMEAIEHWSKSSDMLRFAIEGYNAKWFRYPYPVAINVSGIVGGMEYPMIIFCRGRRSEESLYGVTTHEIGHNWFPMVVNSDERRHAWMDEGFNTFMNIYSRNARYPHAPEGDRYSVTSLADSMRDENRHPIFVPADQVQRGQYGWGQYGKTAHGLRILREQILGADRFDAAFRDYINRWAFKSPQPADFFRTIEDAAGADLAWFWRGWFYEDALLDQGVDSVEQTDSLVRVHLVNNQDMVMPVMLRVSYDDGSTEDRRLPEQVWFGSDRWTAFWQSEGKRVVGVEIDADKKFPDVDRTNNTWGQVGN